MANRIFQIAIFLYLAILALLYLTQKPCTNHLLKSLNDRTAQTLSELVKTKYFRLLRLNLSSDCSIPYMNKICKSKSCSVCRCDEKDIPQNWMKTDRVPKSAHGSIDVWSQERPTTHNWVWHVEDEENDRGEYFDVNQNVESYSGYNGSYIWNLIYEENCFAGRNHYEQMCLEEQIFHKIISGLHTSISSHLSRLHKNITKTVQWADRNDDNKFHFNHTEYQTRVLSHPDRLDNLLFLYEILARAIQQITPYLEKNQVISSENLAEDLQASRLLDELLKELKKTQFRPLNETDAYFFEPNNPHVKQYQKYIHNISRILNCVECEKCKLFGKMQTYGLGTALKILLGYNTQYKRNELVALFNSFNKISISVNTYLNYDAKFRGCSDSNGRQTPLESGSKCPFHFELDGIWVKIWGATGLTLILFLWVISKWEGEKKVKKMFAKTFPKEEKALKRD